MKNRNKTNYKKKHTISTNGLTEKENNKITN